MQLAAALVVVASDKMTFITSAVSCMDAFVHRTAGMMATASVVVT